ncbi:tRNA glutamyl-Q(34) synthetase GluQRS [Thiomicrospira microaerophila]|uniref:tRNA glutamyl-Q(34) synthetase GluQRS n=1 Tax=Thiomicrospira microaerophila TaxID=406020 RepID=UPI0020106754|nr:tRNA glutamyl-Q(34) synthetase GluQRS [Thiomicrospira microaerophila]UQB41368.1 tRNA glutamyl-Q(34) synthetase GluQRS [Thiomicrospira microaerophila]
MPGYVGRFAPTPSGPLHFGSLIAASASFLDAKSHRGQWLVRVDDIDTPRVVPGASNQILEQLVDYGFEWDGEVVYQSDRLQSYHAALDLLRSKHLTYACSCSRKQVLQRCNTTVYDGFCRQKNQRFTAQNSERFKLSDACLMFVDIFQGQQQLDTKAELGDFILKRSDGFFAYHLVCAVDDLNQGVTHVIRGYDLIQSTFAQIELTKALSGVTLQYGHHPLVFNPQKIKYSKSANSPPITKQNLKENLILMLKFLNQSPPDDLAAAEVGEIWQWAIQHWQRDKVARSEGFQP